MNGSASPGPGPAAAAATPPPTAPLPLCIDNESSDDSPLDDLSSTPSDDGWLQASPVPPATNGNGRRFSAADAAGESTADEDGQDDSEDDDKGEGGDGVDADGAHKTTRTNGHAPASNNGEDGDDDSHERPTKRRRTRDATPPPHTPAPAGGRKPKMISPPWKKIGADGPSSFSEGGRRKSGRLNAVPLELQSGDKRITRRAVQSQHTSPPSTSKTPASPPSSTPVASRRASARSRAPAASTPTSSSASARHPPSRRVAEPRTTHSSSSRTRRGSPPPSLPPKRVAPVRSQPSRTSRLARPQRGAAAAAAAALEMPTRTTPRVRLRTRTLTIPVVHPDQTKLRPRLADSLPAYFATAADIPVEAGGLYAAEDDVRVTDDMAAHEAEVLTRIEHETEAGGLLTAARCAAFEPEPADEPPRQWAHRDHMVKAVANFRRLLLLEQQRHRAAAKRLAEACRDAWLRRQPKSAEQLEAEARAMWAARYRIVMRALAGTWDNVRTEINRRRLRAWEAEEQRRVKAALQEAVALSEQKLQARRARQDVGDGDEDEEDDTATALSDEPLSDDDLDDGNDLASSLLPDTSDGDGSDGDSEGDDDDDDDDDDSNMSSSDDDEDDDADGGPQDDAQLVTSDEALTQAQLRAKYANLPTLLDLSDLPDRPNKAPRSTRSGGGAGDDTGLDDDTSDESVDMDDDLGSTSMDSDDDEDESGQGGGSDGDDETEDEDDDEQASGLLGMLFGKAELKKLKAEPAAEEGEGNEKANEANGEAVAVAAAAAAAVPTTAVDVQDAYAATSFMPAYDDTTYCDDDDDDVAMVDLPPLDDDVVDQVTEDATAQEHTGTDAPVSDVAAATMPAASIEPTSSTGEPAPAVLAAAIPAVPEEDKAAASPETDAVTTAVTAASPGRSQSPRTFDTKPSDLDTPMSEPEPKPEVEEAVEAVEAMDTTDADGAVVKEAKETEVPCDETQDAGHVADMAVTKTAADDKRSASRTPAPSTTTTTTPKTEIPFLLRGTLRAYQHYGLDWLAGLYANKTNGILADEMGLGKTIQTIALLAHLACHHEVWGPHLVIVPTSVILNWEMEFKKWCPAFKILTYYGNQDERKRKRVGWTNDDVWNVCITSYQIVVQDQQVFKRRRWHYMILDEAHNIKNFKSQRWQSLLGFNTQARLLLTGTPLQNNLTELWSLLFFLMPPENGAGGFADLSEFHDWFHKPETQILESGRAEMDDEARAIIAKLHQVLRPYLLRRLKADVEKQMPAKYEHVELCRLSKRQRELYDGFLARSDTRATLASGNYLSIINCLMQLRKVCNHPDLFVDRPIMTSFCLPRSVPAAYVAATAPLVRRHLRIVARPPEATAGCGGDDDDDPVDMLRNRVSLTFLNLVPTAHETGLAAGAAASIRALAATQALAELCEAQQTRIDDDKNNGKHNGKNDDRNDDRNDDNSTVQSSLARLEGVMRTNRLEALKHAAYVNALRRQRRPVYGAGLLAMLTLGTEQRPFRTRPRVPGQIMAWFEDESFLVRNLVQPLGRRSAGLETTISRFACVTPAAVARDMTAVLLGRRGVEAFAADDVRLSAPVKRLPFMERQPPRDPWHEARMRLTIQFPDKRLLQYDCGKLQALDGLLRRLQAGGHRALIFTQMTKVLDILEQFLNIHGHKYLRLDGATRIEQRQVLTDRFNHDSRILCFILSTRSGGLGINLTGADTVIFYDQDWNPAMDKQCQDRCHRIGQTRDVHIYRLVSEHTIEANILRKASQKQMLDDVVIQEGAFTTDYFHRAAAEDAPADAGGRGGDGASADAVMRRFREGDAAANAAMDRVLGGVETAGDQRTAGRVLEQAEDTEDVAAARLAEKEILQDDADFSEKPATAAAGSGVASGVASGAATGSGALSVRQNTPREEGGVGVDAMTADAMTADAGTAATATPNLTNAWGTAMHTIDDYMLGWMAAQLEGTALDLPKDKKKSKKKKGKDTRKR